MKTIDFAWIYDMMFFFSFFFFDREQEHALKNAKKEGVHPKHTGCIYRKKPNHISYKDGPH